MRAYYFGNMYLASIQQGIQSLHCTSEMYLKYTTHSKFTTDDGGSQQRDDLYNWAQHHKTVVILNGGESEDLDTIRGVLDDIDNPYAWAPWYESVEALNASLTCVSIILPPRIYDSAKELRRPPRYRDKTKIATDLTDWEFKLVEAMNGCALAR